MKLYLCNTGVWLRFFCLTQCRRNPLGFCEKGVLAFLAVCLAGLVNAEEKLIHIRGQSSDFLQLTDDRHSHDPTFSPDGQRIAYCKQGEDLRRRIWVMDANGNNRKQLTTGSGEYDDWYPVWSPDGQYIAFTSSRDGLRFWVIPATGGEAVAVEMESLGETGFTNWTMSCAWSLDSKSLVFAYGTDETTRDVYTIGKEGGVLRKITTQPGNYAYPKWSPDGTTISFVIESAQVEIWTIPALGGDLQKLNTGGRPAGFHNWSPDGRWIVFQQDRQLWVIPSLGGEPFLVTQDSLAGHTAVWAPDSRSIAYSGRLKRPADLLVWNRQSATSGVLATGLHNIWAYRGRPAWNSDGRQIAFVNQDTTITILDTATGETRHLVAGLSPTWSPDGQRMAYISATLGKRELRTCAIDGSDDMKLTSELEWFGLPSWSPDGEWIAYTGWRNGNTDIFMVPAYGGRPLLVVETLHFDFFPVWLKGENQIVVYTSDVDAGESIWQVDINGGKPQHLASDLNSEVVFVTFAPDNKAYAYTGWPESNLPLVLQTLDRSASPRVIADAGATAPIFSPDGQSVAYYKDRSSNINVWVADLGDLLNTQALP